MPHGSLRGGALPWRFSIPNMPFVKLDLMTSIERSELFLKGQLPVMFLLVFDVPFYLVQVRLAHRKSGVSRLPVKLKTPWAVGLRHFELPFFTSSTIFFS